jgi:hypothetical protein
MTRAAWVALAGWGAALALAPAATVRAVCGDAPVPPSPVVWVLGARQVAQSLALLTAPSRPLVLGAAAVDAVHAASMLAASAVWPQYRRAALTSAGVAVGSALVTVSSRR